MKFSSGALAITLSAASLISAFIPATNVLVKQSATTPFGVASARQNGSACPCPLCVGVDFRTCDCRLCKSMLRMSEEPATAAEEVPPEVVAVAEEVPVEVAAVDGVADETEAHNLDRPARGSGLKKHHKSEEKGKSLAEFSVGDSIEATVKTTTSYGAFLNIGATTDALLHVSCMSDDFVSNVEDVVKVGDVVTVRITNVDTDKNQCAVTMRSEGAEAAQSRGGDGARRQRPRRSDGDRAAQRECLSKLAAGGVSDETFVEGEVVSMLDFGAFVRFDTSQFGDNYSGELDGLVHISALATQRVKSVDSIVSVGEKVQIRVKGIDADGGKVSLSMISKEDEQKAPSRQNNKGKRSPWSDKEMGPKDWKEQMERVLAEQGAEQAEFKNMPVIIDKRK